MATRSERQQLRLRVRQVREEIARAEDWGYFGPDSVIWKVNAEAVVGVGLTNALLLQLAHPFVAQAVADHSTFLDEPAERLAATWIAASYLVFGSRAQADRAARRIRDIHTRVNGHLTGDVGRWRNGTWYSAEDQDALLWVLISLVQTSLAAYERFIGPLSADEEAAYVADAERLGALVGAPLGQLPRSRVGLEQLMAARTADGTVCVGEPALALARACLDPPVSDLPDPLRRVYRSLERTVCHLLLPPALRWQYQPVLGARPSVPDRVLETAVRVTVPHLPRSMRSDALAWPALQRWQTPGSVQGSPPGVRRRRLWARPRKKEEGSRGGAGCRGG